MVPTPSHGFSTSNRLDDLSRRVNLLQLVNSSAVPRSVCVTAGGKNPVSRWSLIRTTPLVILATLLVGYHVSAHASSVTIPDDFASVQAAFDTGADTLLIRSGSYPECLT